AYLRDMYCSSVAKGRYLYHPMDLLMLSGPLSARHEVAVFDALAEEVPPGPALERVLAGNYDAIVFLTSKASWTEDFRFLEQVKKARDVRTIGSGGMLLHEAERVLLDHPVVDAVIDDFCTSDVLTYLEGPTGAPIPNITYRWGERVVRGPRALPPRNFSIPPPRHDLFPLARYRAFQAKKHPYASVLASRGCPFTCAFCIYGTVDFVPRDVENVAEELRALAARGVHEVYFRDYTVGADPEHTLRLCEAIRRSAPGLGWSCQSRADVLDDGLLKIMREAGCHTLLIGVESGDEALLARHAKGVSLTDIRRAFRTAHRLGFQTVGYFILGLPGETAETAGKTIDLAVELDVDFAAFSVAMPFPGTTLYREAHEEGLVASDEEVYESANSFPVLRTGALEPDAVWKLKNEAVRRFYLRLGYVWKKLRGARSVSELRALAEQAAWLVRNSAE
ncbi:MAG: radical SAM protein, partial [Candidatus Methylomirabilis sp.]|nr:radical SAM protein [Deltaproteobacteria bacterium]